ncbi:hypothetical protein [Caulobacter sp. NIBR2454]|uniref:hypothetical protein n=1 Tax=Caulobacter sp. NIBR2454 TaxID=3015996 RepID=UPI0022B5EF32|nr:hypothetical protein [Caulobacter sp. NIBR2454]
MTQATYMSFVPKAKCAKLREVLEAEKDTFQWRERRTFKGSEFYLTGPSNVVREAHEGITLWLTRREMS